MGPVRRRQAHVAARFRLQVQLVYLAWRDTAFSLASVGLLMDAVLPRTDLMAANLKELSL